MDKHQNLPEAIEGIWYEVKNNRDYQLDIERQRKGEPEQKKVKPMQ